MNKHLLFFCVVMIGAFAFRPSLALAQEQEDTSMSLATAPKWSLGAGIGFFSNRTSGDTIVAVASSLGLVGSSAPSYSLSAERRLGDSLWLLFKGSFHYSHNDIPMSLFWGNGTLERSTLTTGAAAGIRYLLVSGIVDVSVYGMVGGIYAEVGGETQVTNGTGGLSSYLSPAPGSTAFSVGATAGLALERNLIDNLSLRLATDLLDGYWSKAKTKIIDSDGNKSSTKTDGFELGVQLRPTLEIRFYF